MNPFATRLAHAIRTRALGDPETEEITPAVRERSGGRFVALSAGVTHHDLRGPEGASVVVLLHGFSVPLYLWDPLIDPLVSAGFRVLRYDLYGRGLSDRPARRHDEDLYDRQLTDLLGALALAGPVHLAGMSMATSIASTFVHRHPERVRSVTFLGAGFGQGRPAPLRLRAPILGECWMFARVAPSLAASQIADLHHPERFPDWAARYRDQMRYRGFRRALLSTLRDYMGRDVDRDHLRAARSGKPVLLVWGAHDHRASPADRARIRASIPHAEAHVLDDAGHLPHVERPDIVAPLLVTFLRRAGAPR